MHRVKQSKVSEHTPRKRRLFRVSCLAQSLNCNSMFCHFCYTVRRRRPALSIPPTFTPRWVFGWKSVRLRPLIEKTFARRRRSLATPAALCDKTEERRNQWMRIISYLSCHKTPRRACTALPSRDCQEISHVGRATRYPPVWQLVNYD